MAQGTPGQTASTSMSQRRDVRPLRSVHTVTPGETLDSIAKLHGLEPQTLLQLNSHAVGGGGVVHAGMRLQL